MTSWLPSHVELTIHQARDLLLKTRNSNSEVYVSVVAEKEKFYSPLLPRSAAPLWQYSTKIPLMSLDTTLQCTVRQKTFIKDKFLGLISIPLGTFTISSRPVTHWYKLGPKIGKSSTKLRGDLLLTIKFLSNWAPEESLDSVFLSNGDSVKLKSEKSAPLLFRRRSIRRTKSEVKARSGNTGEMEGEKASDGSKTKKDKSGRFRLSFRKKNQSSALESCDNDLTLASHSLPSKVESPPATHSQVSPNSDGGVFDGKFSTSESLSRALDPKYLPNGHARASTNEGVERRESELETGGEGEVVGTVNGDSQTQTDKMSPALRYHNFRRRKRPWSMHAIPPTPQTPDEESAQADLQTGPELGKENVRVEGKQKHETKEKQKESEVVTFRAKSNSLVRSTRAHSMYLDSRHRRHRAGGDRESSESCGESNPSTPTDSQLGSTRALRNSDRSTDRSRSSGLGNITHSATLPASVRRRAQSMSEATPRSSKAPPAGRNARKTDPNTRQKSDHQKSIGKGPRVPLAMAQTDSPVHRSSATCSAHLVSGELTAESPVTSRSDGGHLGRNPSPIQLESTLIEEDEEAGETGGNSKAQESLVKQQADQTVKSRVPIETESAAFQVDTRELQVTLEAIPRLSVGRSPTATPLQPGSTSLPNSPSGSPSRRSALPPPSEPESTPPVSVTATHSSTTPTPTSIEPQTEGRAKSTSPIVGLTRGDGESPLCGRSMSTMALAGLTGSEREGGQRSSTMLPRRNKHTVAFKEKSTIDYEAIPALPPSLIREALPQHAHMIRRFSDQSHSRLGSLNSTSTPRDDPGLHNIRTFDPRLLNLPLSFSQKHQPRVSITNASFDDTDSPAKQPLPPPNSSNPHARSVTPESPKSPPSSPKKMVQSYPGTPPERGKRSGGLQAAMTRYQESKRKSKTARKSLDNPAKMVSLSADLKDVDSNRVSLSAGNSPKLQRRAATHLGHTPRSSEKNWRNPFSNLRRTQSQKAARGQHPHVAESHSGSSESLGHSSTSSSTRLELGLEEDQTTPDRSGGIAEVSAQLNPSVHRHPSLEIAAKNSNSNNESGSQIIATPTSLTPDTDLIKTFGSERTLVEANGSAVTATSSVPLQQGLLSLPPTRHRQTAGSLDSEGLGSLMSEEIVMEEAMPQDWAQWSKEDLVKELIHTKNHLHSAEEELKAVRGYLDNLLLRIMETNPGILSVGNL